MKLEDLGINTKTGHHDRTLTQVENRFLGILWVDHVGPENRIAAAELALRFYAALYDLECPAGELAPRIAHMEASGAGRKQLDQLKRQVRQLQNHLITEHRNIPLLSKAGVEGGYWIAETREEAEQFYGSFRRRGLTGLVKAARGKQSAMVDMVQQLTFEFEDLVDRTGRKIPSGPSVEPRPDGMPMAIEVVDSFLAKMLENPEKFSEGLKKIGQKYGSVLLPAGTVARVKAEAARLQDLISQL